jgi:ribosomal protein S18 acetylase RimI-like enzyme
MASGASFEILDLRHFAAPALRPLLEAEGELWMQRLHWDYRSSIKLLMQYLDSHMLPGYATIDVGQISGYVFCVYEENKAVIGDLFALPLSHPAVSPYNDLPTREIEETLLRHLLELLVYSPQVDRIESQLLLHPSGSQAAIFREAGFQIFRRLYMLRQLTDCWSTPQVNLPGNLELRAWRDNDLAPAARLISAAYHNHPDSFINDQYHTVHGSLRFLNNIVRYAGCGVFSPPVSHVLVDRSSHELVALVLGSRISSQCGHITQICVHPAYRRCGFAHMLLSLAAFHFVRLGITELSLTVTEANSEAIHLYLAEDFSCIHSFDAAVWRRDLIA